jgi:tetratricopeptide (TPR) repeat protein
MGSQKKGTKVVATSGTADTVVGNPVITEARVSISNFKVQAVILALLGFVFYANTFYHEAAFDDRMAITDNEYVQAGVAGIGDILTKDAYQSYLEQRQGANQLAGGRYRPLSLISFAIEQQVMGVVHEKETPGEKESRIAGEMHERHVINVLLYIVSVITLLYFLRTIVFAGSPLPAFIAAVIFAVHPLHTEVVANVKSRDEILSVLFISLTFIKAFRYYDSRKTRNLALALVFFFCALLSKEYAVTLVGLLPLSFYLFRKESPGKSFKAVIPYLIPLAAYVLIRMAAVSAAAEGAEANVMNNPYLLATGSQKLASEMLVLLDYLRLLVFPNILVADYSYNQLPYANFANPLVWLSIIVYVGLFIGMCVLLLKRHVVGFAIAFYLFNLALVSNLFFNIGAPMGERLVFHSSVGFAIVVAWLLWKGAARLGSALMTQGVLVPVLVIITGLSAFKTIDRNKDWKNDETLFMHDVKTAANSVLVNNNAAAACMTEAKKNRQNVLLRDEWFTKAIRYFTRAIAIYPQHINAYLNRGVCYYNMGNADKALPDWDTVRKYEPKKPELEKYLAAAASYYNNKGVNYGKSNKADSAIIAYQKSVEASPERPESWYYLAAAYFATGHKVEAKAAIEQSLHIAPTYPEAVRLKAQMQ